MKEQRFVFFQNKILKRRLAELKEQLKGQNNDEH
jgi:hypothetical protein